MVCKLNGHPYDSFVNKPKIAGICDFDESPLIKRKDDAVRVLNQRLAEFEEKTLIVLDMYKKAGILIELDGEGSPSEVLNLLSQQL